MKGLRRIAGRGKTEEIEGRRKRSRRLTEVTKTSETSDGDLVTRLDTPSVHRTEDLYGRKSESAIEKRKRRKKDGKGMI